MKFQQIILLTILSSAFSFQSSPRWNAASSATTTILRGSNGSGDDSVEDRRSFVNSLLVGAAVLGTAGTILPTAPANAGIDPSLLKNMKVDGDVSGQAQRMRQLEEIQRPASDTVNIPYEKLASGVEYREYREGRGDAVVQTGSKIAVELTIRCQSFATANEPGGLKYFTTKGDTEFNELAWTVGSGEFPPGLEEAMMGMKKNGLRRIALPSTQVFPARDANQLPLPTTKEGKRIFDRLFKTDATLLFEVLVTRIRNPPAPPKVEVVQQAEVVEEVVQKEQAAQE